MMAVAVKEICISDRSRRQQVLKEIETLRAATASAASHLMTYLGVRYTEGSIQYGARARSYNLWAARPFPATRSLAWS